MSVANVLILVGLAASILLFLQTKSRLFAGVVIAASGLQALLAFGVIQLGLKGVPLDLVLGAALAGGGAMLYLGVSSKTHVAAATAVTLIGAIQLMNALL